MPSIEPHAGGYRVRYREGGRGSTNRHTPTYKTKREAIKACTDVARMLAAKKSLGSRAGTQIPFDEVIERWSLSKPDSEAAYVQEAKRWMLRESAARSWLTTGDFTMQEVADWKKSMGHRNERRWAVLRAVLRWAAEDLEQAVDARVLSRLKPGASRVMPPTGLLSMAEVEQRIALAEVHGSEALIHCLSLYGWRPVTGARINVDWVDILGRRIIIGRLKNGDPWWHPIFPETAGMLIPLVAMQPPGTPLFRAPRTGERWSLRSGIPKWYARLTGGSDVYDLKRYAISLMKRGERPWTRPLSIPEIKLFTGHRTDSQVMRYLRADTRDLAEMMGCAPGVHRVTSPAESIPA